ncbi:hypothetical protein BDK51DRAFT_32290, partial [Blyttiomyces helicus]
MLLASCPTLPAIPSMVLVWLVTLPVFGCSWGHGGWIPSPLLWSAGGVPYRLTTRSEYASRASPDSGFTFLKLPMPTPKRSEAAQCRRSKIESFRAQDLEDYLEPLKKKGTSSTHVAEKATHVSWARPVSGFILLHPLETSNAKQMQDSEGSRAEGATSVRAQLSRPTIRKCSPTSPGSLSLFSK